MNRAINVTTPLGDVLTFDRLTGREAISELFDFELVLKSETKGIEAKALLGQSVTVDIELDGGARRYLNGQCVHFRSAGRRGRQHLYIAQLRPWLWYASRRSDYRIFQNETVPDIVKAVLAAYPFEVKWLLTRPYRSWINCVQYRETDANFVMRLLEHEGIWFWFTHVAGEHTLVIGDNVGICQPYPGYATIPFYPTDATRVETDHFYGWAAGGSVQSGSYQARDFNFKMPSTQLPTVYRLPADHPHGNYDIFDFPGSYTNFDDGGRTAEVRLEELQAAHLRSHGEGRARGVAPGYLFTLSKHAVEDYNQEYLVVAADYVMSINDDDAHTGSSEHALSIDAEVHPTAHPFVLHG